MDELSPSLADRLARLAPDQRAAATAPPGPVLCIAPAGSGKTTTLIARIAWLIGGPVGADPATITAITFNKRAAQEMVERLGPAIEPLGVEPDAVRVRTFHALGREILLDAGVSVDPLVDRDLLLRELFPESPSGDRRRLDTAFSRLKLDLAVTAEEIRGATDPGPVARAFVAYEDAVMASGGCDFDDLVARALGALGSEGGALLERWRARSIHLLVDEAQDVDRSQLALALILAAPANRIFLVGDDDQSIYGWRLADVRRVLGLAAELPGLRRVDLVTNYRCPRPVVERAVRLIERNEERFAKRIRAGPGAEGRIVLAPDASDETERVRRVLRSWPAEGTRAILARTNRELMPAAAIALEEGVPFAAPSLRLLLDAARLDEALERALAAGAAGSDPLLALGALRDSLEAEPPGALDEPSDPDGTLSEDEPTLTELVGALLAWAPPFPTVAALVEAVRDRRDRLAALRRDDAALTLATAHATKGLEFDHVAVIGLEDGRFPSRRSLADAPEPERALEEERRLAYVAWTRARRSLTLVYDPAIPSPFLLEAFEPGELGDRASSARSPPLVSSP